MRRIYWLAIVGLFVATTVYADNRWYEGKKFNVLFIAIDDLRPEAGCYGNPIIKTPNIDAIAARGTVFTRAYCQQAVCSPSRTSLLTGLRPDTTRVYDLQTHFRLNLPDVITLPQCFKQQGYHTQGLSKIYHGGLDDPVSWTVPHWQPSVPQYGDPAILEEIRRETARMRRERGPASRTLLADKKRGIVLKKSGTKWRVRGPAWEAANVDDNQLPDGQTTEHAIEVLRSIKNKPFFLAVGYLKPHLPFVAPKKYFDLYDRSQLKLAPNPFPPKDCPEIALHNWGELRAYKGIPKTGPLPDEMALDLIHAYYACTSYVDAQIGRLVSELDRLGLRDKTIIIIWGDHGWQLGEHGLWCKHTNFEVATRVLLIISVPGQPNPGAKCDALVEFVDIYPTLCELCGITPPDYLEGTSFVPLIENPKLPWKKAAFSQYPRGKAMGYSIRTDRYRYTEWIDRQQNIVVARELYDHQTDPQENVNLANQDQYQAIVKELSKQLHAGWQAALPEKNTTK